MAFRKKAEGVLTIEQSRDLDTVRRLLSLAGTTHHGVDSPASCYIVAYDGRDPVGVIGVEPKVTVALIRSLFVVDQCRRRGIASALFNAARKAAHTRGARELYVFGGMAGDFWRRLDFAEVPLTELLRRLDGVPLIEFYKLRPNELAGEVAFRLDISRDGLIER